MTNTFIDAAWMHDSEHLIVGYAKPRIHGSATTRSTHKHYSANAARLNDLQCNLYRIFTLPRRAVCDVTAQLLELPK
jgi:hypothetical protein